MAYFRSGISNIQKFKGTAVDVADLPSPIASFRSNASGVKLDSLKVLVEAVQSGSGTPSPDNVRPITGWSGANVTRTGKNTFNIASLATSNITVTDGVATGTAGAFHSAFGINGVQGYKYKANTVYTLSLTAYTSGSTTTGNGLVIGFKYSDGTNTATFIPNSTTSYTRFNYSSASGKSVVAILFSYASGGSNTWNVKEVQVEEGTATAYAPYNGNTYTIAFGDTYYGGELDVTNGVLRVTHQIEDLGNLNYTKYDVAEGTLFRTQISGAKLEYNVNNLLCSAYHFALKEQRANGTYSIPDNVGNLDFINNSYSDATSFKTAMAGQELVYELATPFTIQLSPKQISQLLGENNVFADCGDVEEVKKIQISQIGG